MRKQTNNYYFSVAGETEKYYLEHLRNLINSNEARNCNVYFKTKVTSSPKSFVKSTKTLVPLNFHHLADVESLSDYHINNFKEQLSEMREVKRLTGRRVKSYKLGYNNFTFELWLILHKKDCFRCFDHRSDYLGEINKAFNKSYGSLDDYKKEREFKNILDSITLEDVKAAIRRAELIMKNLELNGYTSKQYKGYEYYHENPSLSLHVIVAKILEEVGLT